MAAGIEKNRFMLKNRSFLLLETTSLNKKTECKNLHTSLSYGQKTSFSAILEIAAIMNTCEKNFPIFYFQAFIFIQNVTKNDFCSAF
jgi:hypothetical protein